MAGQPYIAGYGNETLPSISSNGEMVACAVINSMQPMITALGIYSLRERRWTEYGAYSQMFTVAFSRDGSQVAFTATTKLQEPMFLHVLDLTSKKVKTIPVEVQGALAWSPGGRQLAYQSWRESHPEINIIDLATAQSRKLTDGAYPAWSPTGEWIAYLEQYPFGTRVMLVHPDGSGAATLLKPAIKLIGLRGMFIFPPLWSHDGSRLLLNEVWDRIHWTTTFSCTT